MAAREESVRRSELLEDSRSTLRQVEEILGELGIRGLRPDSRPASTLAELLEVMVRAHREVLEVVESLRRSRGVTQKAPVKHLRNTNLKLREVSATTELAPADMLDGLDRALGLVVQLAEGDDATAGDDLEAAADELRNELHGLIGLLQLQDITFQQLAYASGVLVDVEERLVLILEIFGGDRGEGDGESEPEADEIVWEAPVDAYPGATARNAPGRQALADEIFPGF